MAASALTMREILELPATIDAETAGAVLGKGRSSVYESLRRGDFPGRAIKVNGTWRVITASLVDVLEGRA